MNNNWEEEATSSILDSVLTLVLFLLPLFVVASVVEVALNPNIGQFKLLFIAIAGTPIFILYFKKKVAEIKTDL